MSITEMPSNFDNLEKMSVHELLININKEDSKVPRAVRKAIPQIEALVNRIVEKMAKGGRIFYLGAGTSGRLGVLDASEIPPTFGVHDRIIGLIAGGETALRRAVEAAEDDPEKAWKELQIFEINKNDTVIGIAASGSTPYVIGGLTRARENGILTGCITCNPKGKIIEVVDYPIVVVTGPEFVTGSTRMKAGTAQKLVLNMISTTVMIKLGRVKGNKMVNMQLTNKKLVERGIRMLVEELNIQREAARLLLFQHGSVRKALEYYREKNDGNKGKNYDI
ncbi:MAG TPA: N-acetylmuramic acid 6-phosphate etherase [Bacteroidales bacterium]|nr:N-acetylmuramic acid 6-phosphate etherase [Bacteroidales bacterium]HOK74568.1 N-acetylmuramic acid 6-phosphate etherase [Bacteroidales bacterium]HOM40948.1 N-acetylmuramic acid 6-phosphate etherase [Bacteroidales bacterium]HOU30411.1 N-acetylmuramic acid 6-phosphate etherase [Bacteroidales bacterium]HPP93580.1 N-acetylmuramic acid 6-phosphate etherase [Bacteroidales bacterium]